jgi:outer membrane protein, heavy metal efflux system
MPNHLMRTVAPQQFRLSCHHSPFTFARAIELMQVHSPALKELRAEFATATATANVKTPLPNPAVEVGPQFGFGPDIGSKYQLQPFGSLGFTIPTGKRLKRQDELNRSRAELARMEIQIRSRELFLQLRRQYSEFVLGRSRLAARKSIVESAQKSTALTRRLVEAGQATALDVGLIELDQARVQTDALSAEAQIADVEGNLSELIGVHAEHFENLQEPALPELPETVPALKDLQERLVLNHPALARLRARYEISERELRLEIAKQYPDFHFGPSFERETGEKKSMLGLTLGIDLPVFDRNQQAVATALKRRDEIRLKYEAAANRALAVLDKAWRAHQLAAQKLNLIKTVLLPKTTSNLELARRTLEAGGVDSLRFLETERGQRAVLLDAIDTELSVRAAWIDLEQAVGYPLVLFPSESGSPPNLNGAADTITDHEKLPADQPKREGENMR